MIHILIIAFKYGTTPLWLPFVILYLKRKYLG